MICTKCGQELAEGMNFCTACGAKVERQAAGEAAIEETASFESVEAPSDVCAVCGAPMGAGARACAACGTPTGAAAGDDTITAVEMPAEETVSETVYAVQEIPAVAPVVSATSAASPAVPVASTGSTSNDGRPLRLIIIGAVCAAIVIAAVVIALLFLFGSDEEAQEVSNVTAATDSAQMASASGETEATANEAEGEEGSSSETRAFTGFQVSDGSQAASEAARSVEEVFKDKEVSSMVYTLNDGTKVMMITDSDSFSEVQLNVRG